MPFKEVNQLRKSGRLNEAIQMAESDLERQCDNWSLSALFLCLNDLYKTQTGEAKQMTISRMRDIAQQMSQINEITKKCLEKAEASISPYAQTISSAIDASQQGNAYQAYQEISQIYNRKELPDCNFTDYGWIIYRALEQNPKIEVRKRKELLISYLNLNLPCPSLLHSLILNEAVKIEKDTPLQFLFSAFLNMWDLKNLRDEDWEGGKTESGQSYPSLVEKMITVYVKEMMITSQVKPSDDFIMVLDKAISKFSSNLNLLRNKAQICIKLGKIDEAIRLYKDLIIQTPDKFYLWSELAKIVDDGDLKIALLCKALCLNVSEDFLGKTRITLAQILIDKKLYSWAKSELIKVQNLYNQQGWNISDEFSDAIRKIPAETQVEDLHNLYQKYTSKADSYIFSDLPSILMIKVRDQIENTTNRKTGKPKKVKKWTLVEQSGNSNRINPKRFSLELNMANGQCFDVKKYKSQIVFITPLSEIPKVEWIKEVQGKITIRTNSEGKNYGFVEDCYTPSYLLGKIAQEDYVSGIAIRQEGKWHCVHIDPTIEQA